MAFTKLDVEIGLNSIHNIIDLLIISGMHTRKHLDKIALHNIKVSKRAAADGARDYADVLADIKAGPVIDHSDGSGRLVNWLLRTRISGPRLGSDRKSDRPAHRGNDCDSGHAAQ